MVKHVNKTPEGLKAIPGRKWVRAHYESDATGVVELINEEFWLPVHYFEDGEVPGSVWASAEKTYQVKQFEPLKLAMGASLPCRAEEANAALQAANQVVLDEFMPALTRARDIMKKKGLI